MGITLLSQQHSLSQFITGGSYYNFSDLAQQLLEQDALKICTADTLSDNLITLLTNPKHAQTMGSGAQQVVLKNQGALEKSLVIINNFLAKPRVSR